MPIAHEVTAKASRHPLLARLDATTLAAVVRASELTTYRAKRTILSEGDAPARAYCLLSGAVRVFHRDASGREVTVKLFRAPALFGEMEVIAQVPFLEYARTLETCEVLRIPAQILRRLVATQADFAAAITSDLARRLCIATANERVLAFCDVDTRLANLLLDYATLAGEPDGNSVRITHPLTGESLSRDLAVSRKSMVRALKKLVDEGVVVKRGHQCTITDMTALQGRGSGRLSLTHRL